jgi:carbonic anhydrase
MTVQTRQRESRTGKAAPGAIDHVLDANKRYAETFNEPGLARPPRRKLAVLTCLDCRLHVSKLLGLDLGDAHIIRNAGGIVTEDVLRFNACQKEHALMEEYLQSRI